MNLAWNASASSSIAGYRVYYGATSRSYTNMVTTGIATNKTVSGLANGATYFFGVTAYGTNGLESEYSSEFVYAVPSNGAPVVALTSPINGAGYTAPASIGLAASVTANGHTITKVQFYNGSTLLAEDTSAPYSWTWSNVSAGNYSLTARTVFDAGSIIDSSTASVIVTNPAPTVALTTPLNGSSYTAPAAINLAASVTPNGHTISKVKFYAAGTLLGESISAPYSFTWNNVSPGSYDLMACAVYDAGSVVDSPMATVNVSGLPAPWQTTDIGSVGAAGSANVSNGVYTVKGAGNISGLADNFRFVYQPLTGDGEITVRLNSVENTGPNGRIGVMIRESLTTGSEYGFMGVSPDGTFRWQRRSNTGGSTSSTSSGAGTSPNIWTRLARAGSTLTGYKSIDGTNWTKVSSRNIAMATNIYIGFAVASGSSNTLNTSTFSTAAVIP